MRRVGVGAFRPLGCSGKFRALQGSYCAATLHDLDERHSCWGNAASKAIQNTCGRRAVAVAVAALLLIATLVLRAPTTTPAATLPKPQDAPYTLHVYANLVQNPTLVLSDYLEPVPSLTLNRFAISLDSGPTFHPTRMHVEGDDPINLAVLIDDSYDAFNVLPALGPALASLVPDSLHPHDHVSIYALDCALVRTADSIPADAAALKQDVDRALASPALHAGKRKSACRSSLHLWDSIEYIYGTLYEQPGWRVLLVVSRGDDTRSVSKWAQVKHHAALNGVSVFGLDYRLPFEAMLGPNDPLTPHDRGTYSSENLFASLCTSNGGLVMTASPDEFRQKLHQFATMLRGRYILEYPRPDNSQPGLHSIAITIPRTDFFISVAGLSLGLLDPSIKSDPKTVPSAPSPAVMGSRRPVGPE